MLNSLNMNLVIWDDLDDPYDHNQLGANWQAVDGHDHTAGKGKQIPTAGLQDHSVTKIKLAPDAVTTVEILNGTILTEDLADGAITIGKLDPAIGALFVPVGTVVPWFRPNTSFAVPTGWVICDGSSVAKPNHGWTSVAGAVSVPDLRNAFVLGAATSGTGTTPTLPPAEQATGGSHTRTFAHSHTIAPHGHTVDAHGHVVNAHGHWVPDHNHGIGADGYHNHGMHSRLNAFLQGIFVRDTGSNIRSNSLQSLYIAGFNNNSTDDVAPGDGSHSHGGATGGTGGFSTDAQAPGTSVASPNTNAVGLTTDGVTTGGDVRPNFVGLLYIVKVK